MILAAAQLALVLCDASYQERHGARLFEWAEQVRAEGHYSVRWEWCPRSSTSDPDRTNKVAAIRRLVNEVRPNAVQIFGSVAMPASGRAAPDGHVDNMRVVWGDVPYAHPQFTGTDTNTHRTIDHPLATNVPNDGRTDQNYYTGVQPRCAIARVSFARIDGLFSQPVTYPCHTGPGCPPLDEHAEFAAYMQRNMDHRTGRRPISRRAVWTHRADADRQLPAFQSQLPAIPWSTTTRELPEPGINARYWFGGNMADHWWFMLGADCEPVGVLVFANYRSYCWAWFDARQSLGRALTFGPLVYLWGSDQWRFSEASKTVGDDIMASFLEAFRVTGVWVGMTAAGDLTLPYLDYPEPVLNLRMH